MILIENLGKDLLNCWAGKIVINDDYRRQNRKKEKVLQFENFEARKFDEKVTIIRHCEIMMTKNEW